VKQKLLTPPEHNSSLPVFNRIRVVVQSSIIVWLLVLFPLTIAFVYPSSISSLVTTGILSNVMPKSTQCVRTND
jgi:hypothetical protein